MTRIDALIQELSKTRENAIDDLQRLKQRGVKIVGAYCLFVPEELIAAAGALCVSLCGTSEAPIPHAEKHLPRNLCPLIKSSYGYAVTGTCPYFFYSDLVVGETTCDGKKKMFELLAGIAPVHVMHLPQGNGRESAVLQWQAEIMLLKARLEKDFQTTVTEPALRTAIQALNEERTIYKTLYGLSKLDPPPLWGREVHRVLHGSGFAFDTAVQNAKVRELIEEVRSAYRRGERATPPGLPRILVTGAPVAGATEKIIRIIEESGGVIVCYENCGGAKGREELVDESIEPYEALARKYLRTACSCLSPNDGRMKLLSRLIDEYGAHGVIDVGLQACHTYNIEAVRIRDFVRKEKAIPYLNVETDYSASDEGQLRTRISAFIEMLH